MKPTALLSALLLFASPALAADKKAPPPAAKPAEAAPMDAKGFTQKLNDDLRRLWVRSSTAEWIKSTYITDDTERNAASANEDVMAYVSTAIKQAQQYQGQKLDPETARMLYLLRISQTLIAPDEPAKRQELTSIAAKLEGMYGAGKYCKGGKCRDLQELEDVMDKSRDWNELLDAWQGWHSISPPMRPLYEKLVTLSNDGSKEIGFANTGEMWRAGYDMSPADFEKETERLWNQVKPLYDDLHCYVRGRLAKIYGPDKVKDGQPLPAHILGNMWAQEWTNIYPLVEPYPGVSDLDVTSALQKKGLDEQGMVKLGEGFYTSLGLDPLPKTFWERSQFKKPRDREVVCHASAWDVQYNDDLRIKMCVKINYEDLITVHHELGHDYYFHAYYKLPVLFQAGANDGFHEAIGDALALSVTPEYLKNLGILQQVPPKNDKALINLQMRDALEKVAFLPFGLLIDRWRWEVFSGKVKPADYNKSWWEMRRKYQGIAPPVARSEQDFDPGAKYHIPANVPYTRYFLARLLQFQFHRAMCQAAGQKGPLNECSIYGSKEAGKKLNAMLALGASKPWPDALETLTGQRQTDATALLEYFKPLQAWLKEQNKGQKCGW